ncbi:Tat pathway signal sequence domain protein [Asticcacaulis sp. EMRT-3]|uniref:Tat pathway signal sequence domain protein n=1 Tax=Asticcacaulis sp. EMRT-3 TaxID=3040349 RepID=UPI0024AFE700|nr:Tat pathway signal sequence domain protein [Asticcacaulis sp. EMRT-3]MDI7774197.1 Tat pathway signal sequence domain protein [Asticcacaulis sp. EMRT-3]
MSVVMRRILTGVCLGLLINIGGVMVAHAQMGGGPGGGQGGQDNSRAEQDKKDKEWGNTNLHLKAVKAEGPCPYVKVLYDAARYEEFQDNKESTTTAKWTGQINGVNSDCAYKGTDPILVGMDISFSLGRGPMADGDTKIYHYWVAVTERDKTVLAKKEFDLPVTFAPGQKAQDVNTRIEDIVIPRADLTVSGANFEVLVGFDVTPQMADFNRQGKHFRYVTPEENKSDDAGQ